MPGYVSRSVAGSYDNEAVAIFAMVCTFWLWVKSVKTGSIFWSSLCALAYFYVCIICFILYFVRYNKLSFLDFFAKNLVQG